MNGADESPRPPYQLRRATLEDLPELKRLWEDCHLSGAGLDKRLTEFQVALDPQGGLAGAIGLHIQKEHGLIHSEAFADPLIGSEIRPLLWQRILTVARNNGLVRLWALPTTSFYREQGMTEIDDSTRARFPEGFGSPLADWVTLKLKEENHGSISVEKEFEILAMAQKDETERRIKKAQAFRILAYGLLALALAGLGLLMMFVFGRARNRRR